MSQMAGVNNGRVQKRGGAQNIFTSGMARNIMKANATLPSLETKVRQFIKMDKSMLNLKLNQPYMYVTPEEYKMINLRRLLWSNQGDEMKGLSGKMVCSRFPALMVGEDTVSRIALVTPDVQWTMKKGRNEAGTDDPAGDKFLYEMDENSHEKMKELKNSLQLMNISFNTICQAYSEFDGIKFRDLEDYIITNPQYYDFPVKGDGMVLQKMIDNGMFTGNPYWEPGQAKTEPPKIAPVTIVTHRDGTSEVLGTLDRENLDRFDIVGSLVLLGKVACIAGQKALNKSIKLHIRELFVKELKEKKAKALVPGTSASDFIDEDDEKDYEESMQLLREVKAAQQKAQESIKEKD